jgi:hypothetical protein
VLGEPAGELGASGGELVVLGHSRQKRLVLGGCLHLRRRPREQRVLKDLLHGAVQRRPPPGREDDALGQPQPAGGVDPVAERVPGADAEHLRGPRRVRHVEPAVQRRVDLRRDDHARRRDRVEPRQLGHSRGKLAPGRPVAALGGLHVPPCVQRERDRAGVGERPRDVQDSGVPLPAPVALGGQREVDPLVLVEPHPQHPSIAARPADTPRGAAARHPRGE